jgi:ketosteroid isomerase-like protein
MKMSMISPLLMGVLLLAGPVHAADDPKVAAEIMALARAQWAAEVAGKSPADQMLDTAEDYTEFNGDYPVRIDGKALNLGMWQALSSDGSKSMLGDMANAKVQVYGDAAILTYNFVGVSRDKDGKLSPNAAKSTRVYAKEKGKWMLVHANFAPVATKY